MLKQQMCIPRLVGFPEQSSRVVVEFSDNTICGSVSFGIVIGVFGSMGSGSMYFIHYGSRIRNTDNLNESSIRESTKIVIAKLQLYS